MSQATSDKNGHDVQRSSDAGSADTLSNKEGGSSKLDILYTVTDRPPIVLLFILAIQQFLTMFGATFSYPLLMEGPLCLEGDNVGLSQLISTVIFVSGISTLLQATIGTRLGIIQSVSYGFVQPFFVLLSLPKWQCEPCVDNSTLVNVSAGVVMCGSDEHADMWQARLREIQGAILVCSVFQIIVGFSGLVGLLLKFIGPMTIAPTIAMIGLSLFQSAALKAEGQWWISLTTVALIAIFSQVLRDVNIPICRYDKEQGLVRSHIRFFALFPVLLSICLAWFLCYVLTVTETLPSSPEDWGYLARTDTKADVIHNAPWFRFPYPGQWGVPTVSLAGVLGTLAAVVGSIVESVGDYHACARLSGAPPPPGSAVSRGIGMEGITGLLSGAWGTGGTTTSYSENIGAIGITKVGSRSVVQVSGVIMVIIACVGKFSAIFVTVPAPIVGGLYIAMFSMVTAVGVSNLQHVDLNSSRNLFVLGLALFLGLCVPTWLQDPRHAHAIHTGSDDVDNVITVLCSTNMFVAGVVGFLLDNIIPGTPEERGLLKWRENKESTYQGEQLDVYDLPLIQGWLNKMSWTSYIPFCPGFRGDKRQPSNCGPSRENGDIAGVDNEAFEVNTVL